MISLNRDSQEKLAILQSQDHFRHWNSLDDKRVCVLCGRSFAGHDVHVSREQDIYELRCPTRGCRSHVHQWVYPDTSLVSESAYADWWKALAQPAENSMHAL